MYEAMNKIKQIKLIAASPGCSTMNAHSIAIVNKIIPNGEILSLIISKPQVFQYLFSAAVVWLFNRADLL